jgi:hypothetical protein
MTYRLEELVNDAIEELREWVIENSGEEVHDVITEITDSSVPVYNYAILQLALDNLHLALDEPELGPAFDGSPTPINIIAANIYEYINQALWDAYENEDLWLEDEMEAIDEDE